MNARKRFILSGIVVLAMLSLTIGPSTAQSLCPDPYEPNDTFKDAWNLKPPDSIQSYICEPGDLDFFSFSAKAGEVIDLSLYNLPANYDLCLHGPDEAVIACSTNSGIISESIQATATSTGDHYARVGGLLGAHDSGNPYTLDVQVGPPEPDLIITDVWSEEGYYPNTDTICYQIRNVGDAVAPGGHYTFLTVDGQMEDTDQVNDDLAAGERVNRCFSYISQCSPPDDDIVVCADGQDFVTESDETNNCLAETWQCDTSPPTITSGPIVFDVLQTSAVISWTTDENSDSLVEFGRYAGGYEEQEDDTTLLQEHQITLTGLQPATVYHYVVRSTDAYSNTVTSSEGLFETAPIPGGEPPDLASPTVTRIEGVRELYRVAVPVSDTLGIERVEFYMDGEMIGIDYSAAPSIDTTPADASATRSAAAAEYEFQLDPAAKDTPRAQFFNTTHMVRAEAYDWNGAFIPKTGVWAPEPEPQPISLTVRPSRHPVRHVDGPHGTLPEGATINLEVNASVQEWYTDYFRGTSRRADPEAVDRVVLQVDGTTVYTWTPPDEDSVEFYYSWDVGGLGVGTYSFRATAYAPDGSHISTVRRLSVVTGEPSFDVERSVTRHDNYFRIQLTVQNNGTASASLDWIEDNIAGFQPINKTETLADYRVTADCSPAGERCTVEIDLWNDTGGETVTLAPGEEIIVGYLAVPILYPDLDPISYAIGEEDVLVYQDSESSAEALDRPCEMTDDDELVAAAVGLAREEADYLIVTNPDRLFDLYIDDEVNTLLSTMAELAQVKDGVLGYVSTSDKERVRETIVSWGSEMKGSDGVDAHYLDNGYLLIVGEAEIIGAWQTYHGRIWGWVDYSDLPYGNMAGDYVDPELIVGRIIGNSAAELTIPIRTSIDVHAGLPDHHFAKTSALLVSGRGDGHVEFEQSADDVESLLREAGSHFNPELVDVKKRRIVEDVEGLNMTWVFTSEIASTNGRDVLYYVDHCNSDVWSGVVDVGTFPIDFGERKPLAIACCCLAGHYEDDDDIGIAETFMRYGAPSYIGATELSYADGNIPACRWFFDRWADRYETIGQSFRQLKIDLHGDAQDFWAAEYNLYGDPKYGNPLDSVALRTAYDQQVVATVPITSVAVIVPQYVVSTTLAGEHSVRIPGGDMLIEIGEPLVPIYSTQVPYPAGARVQHVALTTRSGLQQTTGLVIPLASQAVGSEAVDAGPASPAAPSSDSAWQPDLAQTYDWHVREHPDGSSTLVITVYPFYYNPATTNVDFYSDYGFAIEVISSTVEIASLTTDESGYPQGSEVLIGLQLNNSGDAQDVVVDVVVKAEGSGEVVDGLLLHALHSLTGTASFSTLWDSTGFEPGYYAIEATIKDGGGQVLDRQTRWFRLGVYSGEVTAFSATPTFFDVGDTISTSLAFSNTGTVSITGIVRIEIQDDDGQVVEMFTHDVTDLPPSDAVTFDKAWDTSGISEGRYRVTGYVLYDSRSTNIETVIVSSETYVYLPLVLRSR
jgi:hypothetical protein